ncbi:hypothetical protein DO97_08645 [Neosynechococcus sphagnicola sy1]|uniref:Uncharacterized protein n=1 Tax=Neosynechococcus sphagnicola sy1 TaxID=1497020 RepID=A0A098TJN8_9CYAN|nr:hypothetical protein DO97_08645 [Neosynechococcus sphagnicola sy1]
MKSSKILGEQIRDGRKTKTGNHAESRILGKSLKQAKGGTQKERSQMLWWLKTRRAIANIRS